MAIHPSAQVHPGAHIAEDVEIGPNVVVEEHVSIGPRTRVLANAYVGGWTEIGPDNVIHIGAVLGTEPQDVAYDGSETYLKVGERNIFREYTLINRGTQAGSATVIGSDNMFMGYSHIAHNGCIGNGVTIANGTQLAGYVEVGDNAFISGGVMIHQFCRIGRLAMISGLSAMNQDVPPFMTAGGRPCAVSGINVVGLRRVGITSEVRKQIKAAYKVLYRSNLLINEAVERLEREEGSPPEVKELVTFVKASKKGIIFHQKTVEARDRISI
ncbi:MAG: acyl-ACP--UDP-N-acetylglucosamine O-acyltransferase [Planctomycetota bacterium]|jgi:UDP-N-acetylglucosamine acyltransferase